MINRHKRMLTTKHGLNLEPDHQSEAHPTEPPRPTQISCIRFSIPDKRHAPVSFSILLRSGCQTCLANLLDTNYIIPVYQKVSLCRDLKEILKIFLSSFYKEGLNHSKAVFLLQFQKKLDMQKSKPFLARNGGKSVMCIKPHINPCPAG